MPKRKVIIIGSGYGGLSSAALFAEAGFDVEIFEKNAHIGGRAGMIEVGKDKNGIWREQSISAKPKKDTFRFDTGPSWYLMPDVFEHYFKLLGEDINDHLDLIRLDPSYQVVFKDTLIGLTKIHGNLTKDKPTLEALEPQAVEKLEKYLHSSSKQYKIAMERFLYKNYDSVRDFMTPQMMTEGLKLNVLSNLEKYVSKKFTSKELQKILLYHVVFLGASPKNTPALYNIMSHVDFKQGVFYPMGGIYELTKSLAKLCEDRGVKIHLSSPVSSIEVSGGRATGVIAGGKELKADIVISNADRHFTDTQLLDSGHREFSAKSWGKRTMAPSALLMYLGIEGEYPELEHHNLVFSKDWNKNFKAIFDTKALPDDPSFYVCNPNKTDPSVAPKGHENIFALVPLPATLKFSEQDYQDYAEKILDTMERQLRMPGFKNKIVYKKLYTAKEFESDYHSYQGTALGFAHTLKQTAIFRPNNQHPKIPNLLYVGATTVPGIGMPMCLISAELAYKRLIGDKSSRPLSKIAAAK